MKNKLFIVILLLMQSGILSAQSVIWRAPTILVDTTIIREWRGGKYVVYSRQGSIQTVSFHDNLSPTVRYVNIPSSIIINDFRIDGDMAYAGGKILGSTYSYGLLSCFSINSLMSPNVTFYVYPLNTSMYLLYSNCETDSYMYITGVNRIETFHNDTTTCVAFIADDTVTVGGYSEPGCRRVGYGCATFSLPNLTWYDKPFHYNKDAFNLFSDLVVTDNYIALASTNCAYDRLEFVVHNKGDNYAFLPPIPGSTIYFFNDHVIKGKVRATALEDDNFAVAYHYEVPYMGTGVALKVFKLSSGGPTLLYSLEIPPTAPSTNTCVMRDIRYDRTTKMLWLLNDITSPTSGTYGSYIYCIDMTNVYAGTYEARYIPGYRLHSLDDLVNGGYILSGTIIGQLDVHLEQSPSATTRCTVSELVKGYKTTPTMQFYGRHHCSIFPNVFSFSQSFSVYEFPVNRICNQ